MAAFFNTNTTYDPIFALLNADTKQQRDDLTREWREHKLQELNFVGIVGALLAGVLTSTGSWPNVLPDGSQQPWTVRACWYCGIILALASVLVAAQQSIRLHRLSCHRNADAKIRRLLSQKDRCRHTGYALPRRALVHIWQLSVLFLTFAVLAMVSGIFILIWSGTGGLVASSPWWNGEAKLAVSYTIVFLCAAAFFLFEQITLYTWDGKDDSDEDRMIMERTIEDDQVMCAYHDDEDNEDDR